MPQPALCTPPPAAIAEMAVQKGVTPGGRDGLPPQCLRDKGAKRIRSLYLPLVSERLPRLSTTSPPEGPAVLFTINAATMRLWYARADLPATAHSSRLEAAPTAFFLTKSTVRRERRPSPSSRCGVSCINLANSPGRFPRLPGRARLFLSLFAVSIPKPLS
jgi:hypothetical protein